MRFKSGTLVMLLSVLTSISVFAQRNDQPVFTVYVGMFIETNATHFEEVKSLGFPYAIPSGNNLYKIYMGGFTNRADADRTAQVLKARGYQDAYTLELDPNGGRNVAVIQVTTKLLDQEIDWKSYKALSPLHVILSDKQVKITSGAYSDVNSANAQLSAIRKLGFPDAFVKTVNSAFLHEINAFYPDVANVAPSTPPAPANQTIRTIPPDVPSSYNQPSTIPPGYNQPSTIPPSYNQPSGIPPTSNVPASYNQPAAAGPAPLSASNFSLAPKPAINSKLKRSSVRELQTLLKGKGFYSSSIDGYYGKGTAAGYNAASQNNPQVQKYAVLSTQYTTQTAAQPGTLQYAIDNLAENPAMALPVLEGSALPVAKAYLAYYYLATEGPSQKVNSLMNGAVFEAYAKAVRPARTRFDYTSAYVFNDLTQLITPLVYVQVIAKPEISVPCWLIQRHQSEVISAFNPDPALPAGNYALPECGGFMEWQEIRTLVSMARDLHGAPAPEEKTLSTGRAQAMQFLLNPTALGSSGNKSMDVWHTSMVAGVTGWGSRDYMLGDMAYAYKLQYLQSYVLLEDFYLKKGLKADDAKGLAQATLRSLVGPYMTRFL